MKTKLAPSNCPLCGNAPTVSIDCVSNYCKFYRCRCNTCASVDAESYKNRDKELSRFSYGVSSQYGEAAAIKQWNLMVQRYYARQIKDAVKPPKLLKSLREVLEKARYPESKIRYILKAERAYNMLRALADTHGLGTDFLLQLDKEFPDDGAQ